MLEKVLAMWVPVTALLSPLTKCSHLLFLASLIEDSDLWGSLVTSPICGRQCRFRICELLRPCKIPTNSSWLASACSSEEAAFPGPEGMEMGHGVMIWVHSACLCVCARVLLRIAPAMPSIRPPNVKKVKGCQLWRYVKILGGMTSTHLGWFIDIYSDVMICHAPHPNRKMMWRAPSSSLILYVQCFLLAQLSYGESFSWRED